MTFIYQSLMNVFSSKFQVNICNSAISIEKLKLIKKSKALEHDLECSNLVLEDVMHKIVTFLEHGIKVIFVFDCSVESSFCEHFPVDIKMACTRKEQANSIPSSLWKEIAILLKALGVTTLESYYNIHDECTLICKQEESIAILSEDLTFLGFGAPVLLRSLGDKASFRMINLSKVLTAFDMKQEQFTDLCILLGCDYSKPFTLLTPAKIFEYVSLYKEIERILHALDVGAKDAKADQFANNMEKEYDYMTARKIVNTKFEDKQTQVCGNIEYKDADLETAYKFLVENKFMNKDIVTSTLNRINKQYTKVVQKRLEDLKL
jgi:5'-3' exonuclease